jgi:hypothetical protein
MMYDMADGLQSCPQTPLSPSIRGDRARLAADLEEFLTRHANAGAALREFLADYQAIERLSSRVAGDGRICSHDGQDAGRQVPAAEVAASIRKFRALEEIARGGMGIVYKRGRLQSGRIRRA